MHTARPPTAFIPPIKKIGIDRNHVSRVGLGRPATDTSGTATEQMGLATLELVEKRAEATSEAQDTVALPLRCPRHCLPGVLRICFSTSS